MPDIAYVYFCTDTKQEVAQRDLDSYLTANPTHTLIECIRRADNILNGQPPFVETILPIEEQEALATVNQALEDNNGVLVPPTKDTWMATFSEASVGKNSWVNPGIATAADVGFVAPFDCKLVTVTVCFSHLQYDFQSIEIVKGLTSDTVVYSTPWYLKDSRSIASCLSDLDVSFCKGDAVRCSISYGNGTFKSLVVTALFERV